MNVVMTAADTDVCLSHVGQCQRTSADHAVIFYDQVRIDVSFLKAWKGHPWNDLSCVGRDVKPYSLTFESPEIYYRKMNIN